MQSEIMPGKTAANSLAVLFYHAHRHIWASFLFPLVLLSCVMLWPNVSPQMHCSGLAWHPEVATQMVLASEDDRLPVIQMWDLRFASSPLRVLESHTRYEAYIEWCAPWYLPCWCLSWFVHPTSCCSLGRKAPLVLAISAAASAVSWLADQPALCHESLVFLELGTLKEAGPRIKLINKPTRLLKQ